MDLASARYRRHFAGIVSLTLLVSSTVFAVGELTLPSRVGDVVFSHARHAGVPCGVCHHRATGENAFPSCRDCHRVKVSTAPPAADAFHGGCITCHDRMLRARLATGPSKRCSGCHRKVDPP